MLNTLHTLLTAHPLGLSEHQLIQQLKRWRQPFFLEADLSDPLSLFRTHFVLFNALYQLRDQLRATQTADIQIGALMIRLQAYPCASSASTTTVQSNDPLRAYYLDLQHLQATDRSAAEALLYGTLHRINPPEQVQAALTELGIEQPLYNLSKQQLRQQYRQLVSQHHPDRGGCTQRLQRINQAMDVLHAYQSRDLLRR